jgi:hypothetical protein
MSSSDPTETADLPLVRWRLARVLVAAICVQLAAVSALLAVGAVEPADAEELLTAIAVPLYPLLGSVVTFYFATRRLGRTANDTYLPALEPYWYNDHDNDWSFDEDPLPTPTPKPVVPTINQADVDRICALARWALATAATALVAATVWTVCSRVRPPQA